jgi:hypothetical protein
MNQLERRISLNERALSVGHGFIYIALHTYVCTYAHMYVHMHICMYICTYVCTYAHMYVHMRCMKYEILNRGNMEVLTFKVSTPPYVCLHKLEYFLLAKLSRSNHRMKKVAMKRGR